MPPPGPTTPAHLHDLGASGPSAFASVVEFHDIVQLLEEIESVGEVDTRKEPPNRTKRLPSVVSVKAFKTE
jgi:hypothetical protein